MAVIQVPPVDLEALSDVLKRSASVSVVARRHDVNANLAFKWRQRYGRHDEPAGFLPVVAVQEPAPAAPSAAPVEPPAKRRRAHKAVPDAGFIEIEFSGGHRVRVHGSADVRIEPLSSALRPHYGYRIGATTILPRGVLRRGLAVFAGKQQ